MQRVFNTRRRLHAVLAVTTALSMAAACSSGGADTAEPPATVGPTTSAVSSVPTTAPTTAAPTTVARSTSTTTSTTTTLPPIARQPLTGVPLADDEEPIQRAALAVKIDNHSSARRNHSGLAVADIVFEEIVEGQITRFAAVFHSQGSDTVGPIRSGRSQDVDLLSSFVEPLFAWSGGNAGVTRLIADSTMVDLNAVRGGKGYYRGSGSTPHNLYNSTDALWDQTPEGHPGVPPPQQFEYLRPKQKFKGKPVDGVELPLRSIDVEWTWDADSGRFLRSQEGGPHTDVLHGRIGAENVIVMSTWYRPSAIDANSPEAQTITERGPLWVFSDGQVVEGFWRRIDALDPIRLFDTDENPIALTPGITWVELAEAEFTGDAGNPITEIEITPRS